MKEEAPSSKKMPRKLIPSAPLAPSTPTKIGNDEILSTLLRLNNFDSNIKDESLDIDLSACVTINSDSVPMLGGANSLSSDFWRVLDESAQAAQLDLTLATSCSTDALDDGIVISTKAVGSATNNSKGQCITTEGGTSRELSNIVGVVVKQEQKNTFSGTFLRPEMPAPSQSPLKRIFMRSPAVEQTRSLEQKEILEKKIRSDLKKKVNSIEELRISGGECINVDVALVGSNSSPSGPSVSRLPSNNYVKNKTISSSSFNIFMSDRKTQTIGVSSSSGTVPGLKPVTQTNQSTAPEVSVNLNDPLFKCVTCCLLLHGKNEFTTHEALGHRIFFRCAICERDFEQEAGLKKHIKTHRSVDARKDAWKKCPDCGKCLKLGSMWMHRKIHTDNKKYGCDICGQKFVQKINLTHHARIHTAEKPYECPECQKRFQERSHLQRHQKYHAQTRSYRCDKCGKMYKTERCLKVHNLVHLEQRPFACTVCDKSFISNSKLKQHSNIHTGERPFKCNYCPRDFTNFPNWLKHTRRRHKVDHKTGEHLENIPSYCSKKSTKSKQQKTAEAKTEPPRLQATNSTEANVESISKLTSNVAPATAKSQATKRKKKTPPPTIKVENVRCDGPPVPPLVVSTPRTDTLISPPTSGKMKNLTSNAVSPNTNKKGVDLVKANKPKRERKQVAPKQVQKLFPPILLPTTIKQEIIEPSVALNDGDLMASLSVDTKCAFSNFPDLSITSAEELIMEQALEMEECGLYMTPPSVALDTDNAISSEAAAALHFKIKNELDPVDLSPHRIKEEFITLKDVNQRLLCSSLESSPYSSPASIELSTTASVVSVQSNTAARNSIAQSTTAFYMPSFSLNTQNVNMMASLNDSLSSATTPEMQQILPQPVTNLPVSTQAIINRFYLHPIMPMLTQPTNQKLPSVDTLLFSTSVNSNSSVGESRNYFQVKNLVEHSMASTNATQALLKRE